MTENRENWGSKIGLILAMAGNAVGLGNFWRFPYVAASNGGGAFMIPYFFALIVIGIPVMLVEWSIGRYGGKYGHGTLGPMMYLQAKQAMKPKKAIIVGALCGMIAFGVTILVNSYYNHIIGWSLGFAFNSLIGGYNSDPGAFFANYIQDPKNLIFWVIALCFLSYAVMRGIQKGIESWAKIMMPTLYVFGIILAIRSLTLGTPVDPDWSSLAGLNFIWNPDFSALSWSSAIAAAGQIFFTLSLGMGIIQNYASYLKPDEDIITASVATVSLNEFAEVILGGTAVIPIAYAFLGPDGIKGSIGLAFMVLPNVFTTMTGGGIFGAIWFLLLFFAGITSAIAMYNYLVALLEEDAGIDRKKGAWLVLIGYLIVGAPIALESILTKSANLVYFTEVDNWIGNYILIVLGLIEIVVIGWCIKDRALDEMNRGGLWKVPKWFFRLFHQFLTPVTIITFLIFFTRDYWVQGNFKVIPSYIADIPEFAIWVNLGRVVVFGVLLIGFIQSYKSIKTKYSKEIESNKYNDKQTNK
ncbi:Na+dependent transporter [Romboutsia ilealis]|uniref:Transporter n=1 Tax=Romboutsia faecis TaxID=2764597 RepID=A0ABR7JPZ2_9FIRM|nr:sodium-dependent transporter [Romboutsia faecis]MBC5996978.1 sodium-dependent transporter [Romboutsia faecis]MRN25282.1 Na+dependent transporter [Romboutsia ilealis]